MFNRLINKVFKLHKEVKKSRSFKSFCVDKLGYLEDPFFLENFYKLIKKHDLDESFKIRSHFILPKASSLREIFETIILVKSGQDKGIFLSTSDAGFHVKKERTWINVIPSKLFSKNFDNLIGSQEQIRGFDLIKIEEHYVLLVRLNFDPIDSYRKPVAIVSDISMLTNLKEVRSHELFN